MSEYVNIRITYYTLRHWLAVRTRVFCTRTEDGGASVKYAGGECRAHSAGGVGCDVDTRLSTGVGRSSDTMAA